METAREIKDGGPWCTDTNDEPQSLPCMGSEDHESFNYYLILHTFRDGPASPHKACKLNIRFSWLQKYMITDKGRELFISMKK